MHDTEIIAKACHQVNKAYCEAQGDTSQQDWDEAPEWQRESARDGVRFHLANPGAGAGASHENWMRLKREAGWRYGPVKDPEAKTHPCLVAFEALPLAQQIKDLLFVSVVAGLSNSRWHTE